MKYVLSIAVLLLGYVTIRSTAYNVDSSYYFEYLRAEATYNEEMVRADYCELVWKLRKSQSIPLFTNCYKDFDSLIKAENGKKVHKFGTSIFDREDAYQIKVAAMYKYKYAAKNKYKIALKVLVGIKDEPQTMKAEPNFYRECTFDGKQIIVYHKYEYGYHAPDFPNGELLIPDALRVTDCKEPKE